MKNFFKRVISLLITGVMLFSVSFSVPVVVNASDSIISKLDAFISNYPSGGRWTSSFDGGIQCYGFAKLVVYNLFGKSDGTYRSWRYNGTPTTGMVKVGSITSYSSANVKNLLNSAKSGDVLQFDETKQHSMIVYKVDSDGVWIYDCNWDSNCGISLRKSGFGTWSGRNSAKLTLLRADNYTDTHKVDTSYGTNFTAYPKEKITASNIFDVNHNQISSTAWIGTSDKCTIHEVYTDGCCKISYPLDSGGSQTVYSKASLFNIAHTHSYTGHHWEGDHPHRVYQKCSCGVTKYVEGEYHTYADGSCLKCVMPGKPVFLNMKDTYTNKQAVKFEWKSTTNTTHYNIYLSVKNSQGNWVRYDHMTYVSSGVTKNLPIGEYRCNLQSYNSKFFWEDGSDWLYTEGDYCYFNVVDAEYTVNYNANGGTGAPASQTKIYGQTLTLSSVKPTRTGYTFLGWALNSTDTSVKYNSGASYTPNKAVTLYAVWKPNNLTVYYMANGGLVDSSTYGVGSDVIYTLNNGEKFTQIWTYNNKAKYGLGNAASFGLYKTGHTFKGWGTTSTGGKIFDENNVDLLPTEINSEIKTGNCSIALYAIWEPITYTVSYNANGGTGAPDSQIKVFGHTLILSSVKPTRTGYTFLGWALNSTDTSVKYNLGDSYTTNSGVELFAVWEENHTCSFKGKEEIVNKVTCTENGSKKVYCSNADCEKYQLMTIVSKGHDYSEWVVTKEATLKEPGEKMRKCYVCRDAEIEVIAPLVPPIIIGDTNGDGRVNIKDATEIQKAVAGAITFGEVENLAADVDGNTRVNVKDATAIQKWIAGIETGFPIGDEKTF